MKVIAVPALPSLNRFPTLANDTCPPSGLTNGSKSLCFELEENEIYRMPGTALKGRGFGRAAQAMMKWGFSPRGTAPR
jgi:hypothetical protein